MHTHTQRYSSLTKATMHVINDYKRLFIFPTSLFIKQESRAVARKPRDAVSSPGECGWLRACGKARGRHFERFQLTGSIQSHPHSPGEDTCLWRTEKTQFPGSCFPR